ncbi:MAG: class I SAM-dependent rRNA methyltransferase [Terriglobales bacterium]
MIASPAPSSCAVSTPEEASTAVLNDRASERVRGGHPWVYASDILGWEPAPPPATSLAARLRDRRGQPLGWADRSPQSKIQLRLLTRDPAASPDREFFQQRLAQALAWRQSLVADSDAYRLVSSEADGLPGLIVDRYGSSLVIQALSWAMDARQESLVADLAALLNPTLIVERNEARVRLREGLALRTGVLSGVAAPVEVSIHGLRFVFELLGGQKTGGFLDQRENWAAAAHYARALGCHRALDVFTYQGGFALHLARAGLAVEALDSSRPALEAADANATRNHLPDIDWVEANAFDLLRDYDQRGEQFDCVVLDPPAFAKSRAALSTAAAGYKEINLRALKLLSPGGLLVSCSCSHHLNEAHLLEILAEAARDARRQLRILERRTQAADHPILLGFPESAYLKCILAVAL